MKISFQVQFLLILLLTWETKGKVYDTSHIKSAVEYIKTYGGTTVGSIAMLDSASDDIENDESLENNFKSITLINKNNTFALLRQITKNDSNSISRIMKSDFSSLVILLNFEFSKSLQNVFSEVHSSQLITKSWLISMTSNFQSYDDMYSTAIDSISLQPNSLSRFTLKSHVYILATVNGIAKLFEMYQRCSDTSLVIYLLTTITSNDNIQGPPNKHFLERRSNLHLCPLRVGYFEVSKYIKFTSPHTPNMLTVSTARSRQFINENGLIMYGPITQYFSLLQSRLNFSIKWVHIDDKEFGTYEEMQKNMEWNHRNDSSWNNRHIYYPSISYRTPTLCS